MRTILRACSCLVPKHLKPLLLDDVDGLVLVSRRRGWMRRLKRPSSLPRRGTSRCDILGLHPTEMTNAWTAWAETSRVANAQTQMLSVGTGCSRSTRVLKTLSGVWHTRTASRQSLAVCAVEKNQFVTNRGVKNQFVTNRGVFSKRVRWSSRPWWYRYTLNLNS